MLIDSRTVCEDYLDDEEVDDYKSNSRTGRTNRKLFSTNRKNYDQQCRDKRRSKSRSSKRNEKESFISEE